jgi:hypothetical protein
MGMLRNTLQMTKEIYSIINSVPLTSVLNMSRQRSVVIHPVRALKFVVDSNRSLLNAPHKNLPLFEIYRQNSGAI